MKLSKRNLRNEAAYNEKRSQGKPLVSKFERKRLTPEELQARERAAVDLKRKGNK